MNKTAAIAFGVFFTFCATALGDISSRLNIKTQDGTVNTYPYSARFTNGSVTDNGDGTVSVTAGAGSSVSLPLPGGATNYWNITSTGTFPATFGVLASTLTATSLGNSGNICSSSGLLTTVGCANGTLTGNQTITLSGDSSGSGATSIAVTAAASQGNVQAFTSNITVASTFTVTTASVSINGVPQAFPSAGCSQNQVLSSNGGSSPEIWTCKTPVNQAANQAGFYNGSTTTVSGSTQTVVTSSSWTFLGPVDTSANTLNVATTTVVGNQSYMILYSSTVCIGVSSATTSNLYGSVNQSITVTPHRTTSQIEVDVNGNTKTTSGLSDGVSITVFRGGTNLAGVLSAGGTIMLYNDINSAVSQQMGAALHFIDLPATTSATTYAVKMHSDGGGAAVTWNPSGFVSCMTVKEWAY